VITLRQLHYFASLAQHRHFGQAARACSVSQPALSMQIKALEREVGADLIDRRTGAFALTPTGAEVLQRAERLLASARDLVDFGRHREVLAGRLKLGAIPTLAPYLLPRLLPRLRSTYKALQLQLRETQTVQLIYELIAGELDCALLALPVENAEIETLTLFEDRFLLAVPAGEPMPRRPLEAKDLHQSRLLLLEEGHCLRDQALAFCTNGRQTASTFGSTSLTTVMQMVANGYGVTLLPEIATQAELHDKRVLLKRFAKPEPGRTIGLAWRKTSPRQRDIEALGEAVKATVRKRG
jgi:LysR family transcriptional regulator, hydrogen peroxide-inducible genes activator